MIVEMYIDDVGKCIEVNYSEMPLDAPAPYGVEFKKIEHNYGPNVRIDWWNFSYHITVEHRDEVGCARVLLAAMLSYLHRIGRVDLEPKELKLMQDLLLGKPKKKEMKIYALLPLHGDQLTPTRWKVEITKFPVSKQFSDQDVKDVYNKIWRWSHGFTN